MGLCARCWSGGYKCRTFLSDEHIARLTWKVSICHVCHTQVGLGTDWMGSLQGDVGGFDYGV